jgi:3-hydroxybutyryl-CoA dehydrogenase
MIPDLEHATVLVVGAGVMGGGITQVAAQSGHQVLLYDSREGAAVQARDRLAATLDQLAGRGKMTPDAASATLQRVRPIADLADIAGVGLVIEAVIEDEAVKRDLLAELEGLLADDVVLATNTSSISVTAIARGLDRPERVVGMHFFNPVPLMKLVEVVSGLETAPGVAEAVFALAGRWGKAPVHAASTPGFIVNRIARPFYAEALELLQQRATDHITIDACLRGAGFRMGPCELMDLIGLDTNLAVTESVYRANFMDKRYKPSLVQKSLVEGGRLGRKSGRGFYDYSSQSDSAESRTTVPTFTLEEAGSVILHGAGFVTELLARQLRQLGVSFEQVDGGQWTGIETPLGQLRLTEGLPATALGENVSVFDLPIAGAGNYPLAVACSSRASDQWREQGTAWLAALGFIPRFMEDAPGLVVARTMAMLINEAADAVQQGVCDEQGADNAMKTGVNYPAGPFEWLGKWGAPAVVILLDRLDAYYRGERYRVSPLLRQRIWE